MMGQNINIGSRSIGLDHPPFIIAEISGNHNQSLDTALQIVEAAAQTGAHAVKLQTYTADTMTLDIKEGDFFIDDPHSLWKGRSLYELYDKAHTPWKWHETIFNCCKKLGVLCFSTPFDETAVDLLESLDAPCYKIASFENTDQPLIRKVASTGKPLIVSVGMASVAEIDEAVRTARDSGCKDIVLLKCTSTYPASPLESNLRTLPHMRELFGCEVGVSDHTLGIGVSVAAVALGATVIEKHVTLSRSAGGIDAAFSLEPKELSALVQESKRAWQALGQIQYDPSPGEKMSKRHRRSLYIVENIRKGEILTTKNMKAIRPGLGLSPKYLEMMLGKRVNRDVSRGTPVDFNLIG